MPHVAGPNIKDFLALASDPKKLLKEKEDLDARMEKAHAAEAAERVARNDAAKVLTEVNTRSEQLAVDTLEQTEALQVREELIIERERRANVLHADLDRRKSEVEEREAISAEAIGQADSKIIDDRHAFDVIAANRTGEIDQQDMELLARENAVSTREKKIEDKESKFKNRLREFNEGLD